MTRWNRNGRSKVHEVYDLPQLVGTEKQVPWANDIRERIVQTILSLTAGALSGAFYEQDILLGLHWSNRNGEGAAAVRKTLLSAVRGLTDAQWWIDHRRGSFGRRAGTAVEAICWKAVENETTRNEFAEAVARCLFDSAAAFQDKFESAVTLKKFDTFIHAPVLWHDTEKSAWKDAEHMFIALFLSRVFATLRKLGMPSDILRAVFPREKYIANFRAAAARGGVDFDTGDALVALS